MQSFTVPNLHLLIATNLTCSPPAGVRSGLELYTDLVWSCRSQVWSAAAGLESGPQLQVWNLESGSQLQVWSLVRSCRSGVWSGDAGLESGEQSWR